jgi:chromosomal replication initiation ATPase DnaA
VSGSPSPVAGELEPAPCQLVLDLPHAAGDSLVDFMPAPSNRAALDAVLGWPAWPAAACLLIGPAACGKSHLAKIWAQRSGAVTLRGPELWEPAEPLRRIQPAATCVVDDADEAAEEAQLFHLWNRMAECGGSLLLTARSPVPGWGVRLPDLRSRLLTAWPVRIGAPDDELLGALLVKQLADRQIRAEHEVVAFLTRRIERSFAAARAVVRALDRASLRARRPITMPLARAVLDELAQERTGEGES